MRSLLPLLVAAVAASTLSAAQPDFQSERILLPVYGDVTGLGGARFSTLLMVQVDTSMQFLPAYDFDPSLPPRKTVLDPRDQSVFLPPGGLNGRFVFVEALHAGDFHASLELNYRAADESLANHYILHPVRESEFRAGPLQILGMRLGNRFRRRLRIYTLDGESAKAVVRVFEIGAPPLRQLMGEAEVNVSDREGADITFPTFASVDLDLLFGSKLCVTFKSGCLEVASRVEVSLDTPVRFWAFVTVTDNETQRIVAIYPE